MQRSTQQLVAAKSRLAKTDLSILRLELVSAHMATNLLVNVCSALPQIGLSNLSQIGLPRSKPTHRSIGAMSQP